jgi:hypothetical protein
MLLDFDDIALRTVSLGNTVVDLGAATGGATGEVESSTVLCGGALM